MGYREFNGRNFFETQSDQFYCRNSAREGVQGGPKIDTIFVRLNFTNY